MIPRTIAAGLAMLMLGAHFLRAGSPILAAVCALLPLWLLVRRRLALRVVQLALAAGVLIWLHTAFVLTWMRMQAGAPWLRMLLILSAVSLFTGWCVRLLNNKTVTHRFPNHGG